MEDYLIGIGKKIRELRKEKKLYASELAQRASVSNALISRIESGQTIPSLPVLLSIIDALGEEPGQFFEGIARESPGRFSVIRAEDNYLIEKESSRDFTCDFVFSKRMQATGFEAVVLSVHPQSQRRRAATDAFEFQYMLQGECDYEIGDEVVTLRQGDALFLDGRIPHVPRNPGDQVARVLVLYLYTADTSGAPSPQPEP